MPDIAANSIVYIGFDGVLDGQQVLLTTHWKLSYDGGGTDTDMVELNDLIHAKLDTLGEFNATLLDCYSDQVENVRNIIQWIYPTRYVRFTYVAGTGQGAVNVGAFPPNVSHVITLRTDVAGPTEKGNKHLGGVPSTFSEDGFMNAVGAAAYDPLSSWLDEPFDFALSVGQATLTPLILHAANPALSKVVTNSLIQQTTRVMRRRTVGLGS